MSYYFERQRAASAALAPEDETEKVEETIGDDVKKYPVDSEPTATADNEQLSPRFESRSL